LAQLPPRVFLGEKKFCGVPPAFLRRTPFKGGGFLKKGATLKGGSNYFYIGGRGDHTHDLCIEKRIYGREEEYNTYTDLRRRAYANIIRRREKLLREDKSKGKK